MLDSDYQMREDPLISKEKEAYKKLIAEKKAKFSYKTTDILASLFCCRIAMPRTMLRKKKERRNTLYFKLGIEHIDKEMDISYIIKKIRTLNFFMKMILDTD